MTFQLSLTLAAERSTMDPASTFPGIGEGAVRRSGEGIIGGQQQPPFLMPDPMLTREIERAVSVADLAVAQLESTLASARRPILLDPAVAAKVERRVSHSRD